MSQPGPQPWVYAEGGITRSGDYTIFRLCGLGGGQSVAVATERLKRVPGLYREILDRLARDVQTMQKGYQ